MKKKLLEVRDAMNWLIRRVDKEMGPRMNLGQEQVGLFEDSLVLSGLRRKSSGQHFLWAEKRKTNGLHFSWADKGNNKALQPTSNLIQSSWVKHAHFKIRSSSRFTKKLIHTDDSWGGDCIETLPRTRQGGGWHPVDVTLATCVMVIKHASNIEKDTQAVEINKKGNWQTIETPLEASKHTRWRLNLTMAQVEKGHCKIHVVRA